MALIKCRECGNDVSDRALMCPHCGLAMAAGLYGCEYRSRTELFGLPLMHVATGVNPLTGRPRVAKGIIAVGNIAVGVFAVGGVAVGGIAMGGVGIGLVALGGVALAVLLGVGGLAIGTVAVGGMAIGYYALGAAAFGAHPCGANAQDPEAVEFFKRYLGSWVEDSLRRRGVQ